MVAPVGTLGVAFFAIVFFFSWFSPFRLFLFTFSFSPII